MAGENGGGGNHPNQSPASSDQGGNLNSSHFNGNPPSTPDSLTSAGFNTDHPPFNSRTSENYSDYDDKAVIDPNIIRDDLEDGDEDEGEGEDLFNDNYIEDYRRINEHDQYESAGLDDSLEDKRDLNQIMVDRRAAEIELDTREGVAARSKLPNMLHDQDTDDDSYRPSKRNKSSSWSTVAVMTQMQCKALLLDNKGTTHHIIDILNSFFSFLLRIDILIIDFSNQTKHYPKSASFDFPLESIKTLSGLILGIEIFRVQLYSSPKLYF